MLSQTIRVYNDCSECCIKMRIYSVFPFTGLILTLQDFGDVGPGDYIDILCRLLHSPMYSNRFQEMHFDVGQNTKIIKADDIKGCKEIRFIEKNGMIMIEVIEGNYLERIGIVWKLKDFASKLKQCVEKMKKFVKRGTRFNENVGNREPLLLEPLRCRKETFRN